MHIVSYFNATCAPAAPVIAENSIVVKEKNGMNAKARFNYIPLIALWDVNDLHTHSLPIPRIFIPFESAECMCAFVILPSQNYVHIFTFAQL